MRPLHDVLLIKEIKDESSKIIVSESQSEIAKGEIVAVGDGAYGLGNEGVYLVPIRVKAGWIVYYIREHALKIKDLWAIKEKDIVCVE